MFTSTLYALTRVQFGDLAKELNTKRRIRVLFVDDDQDFLATAKECLTLHANMDVETALSSEKALEQMKKRRPDVVVCDIQKPSTNGFELLKILREKGATIPFIVFTLTDKKELAIQAFQLGANGFVGKGDDPKIVLGLLGACIQSATKKTHETSTSLLFGKKKQKQTGTLPRESSAQA